MSSGRAGAGDTIAKPGDAVPARSTGPLTLRQRFKIGDVAPTKNVAVTDPRRRGLAGSATGILTRLTPEPASGDEGAGASIDSTAGCGAGFRAA